MVLNRFRIVIICLALLLEGMSTSGINVQLGALHHDLGIGDDALHLVASAFLIAYAGILPIAGALADRLDRRRVFRSGIALFGVGCVVCALAFEPVGLIAGRVVQGMGAALSAPAALALITQGLPQGAARNRAVAIYGAMGAAGFSLGLVLPGAAVTLLGWRWSFLISVPVVLLVFAATLGIPASERVTRPRPDVLGSVLLTVALMLCMHLLGVLTTAPWMQLVIEAALLFTVAMLLVMRRGVRDIPRAVVASPRFQASAVALGSLFAGVVGSMYALSLAVAGSGFTALETALLIVAQPVLFSLTAAAGARIVTRWGAARTFGIGAVVFAAGLCWLTMTVGTLPLPVTTIPAMAAVGVSLGLCFPAASVGAVDATPAEYRATTAGLLTTAQNTGGAFGIAALTALGAVATSVAGMGAAMLWSAVFALVGVGVSGMLLWFSGSGFRPAQAAVRMEVSR